MRTVNKKVHFIVGCTLLLLFTSCLISTAAPVSRTVKYEAEIAPFGKIDKDVRVPDWDPFHLYLKFFLSPGTMEADLTGEVIFDQENGTITMRGQDGIFRTDGGISFTGSIQIDFVIPARFFEEFFNLANISILNLIFNIKDVHLNRQIPLFKYGKDWRNATDFSSLLLSGAPVQVRAGVPDILSKKVTVEDLAGVIVIGLTGIPPSAVKIAKKIIQHGLGSSGISLNAGLTSDLTLSCKVLTVNGIQVSQEGTSIPAPGLDLSQDNYPVNTDYIGDLGTTLDLLFSADYEFAFNPLGILIWEYDEPFAELPINIIPQRQTDLVFDSDPAAFSFPIVAQAPAAQGPRAVNGNRRAVTLTENGRSRQVDVAPYFSSENALRYRVTSRNTNIATISPAGWQSGPLFTIQPRNAGSTTVVITAEDPTSRLTATQTIAVTVEGPPPDYTDISQPITNIPEEPTKGLGNGTNVVLILNEAPHSRNIRDDPGFNSNIVGQVDDRDTGIITDGPEFKDGHTWYEVEWDHLPSWNNPWWISAYREGTQVLVHNPPDLEIYDFDVIGNTVKPGASLRLEVEVKNNGPGSSDATKVIFYYSTKRHVDLDALYASLVAGELKFADIGGSPSVKVDPIHERRSKTIEITVDAPLTPHTDYYYGAILPPEPVVVTLTQSTNNFTTRDRPSRAEEDNVEVTSDPDFIVPSISANKSTLDPGEDFRLEATVKNRGLGTQISDAYLYYYRSSDATITANDRKVGDRDRISELDTDETGTESISLSAPSTPGVYYYGACVDYRYELKKDNNCSPAVAITVRERAPTQVQDMPDLIVDPPRVSTTTLNPGEAFTLDVIVKNQGNSSANATTLRCYRSSNTRISSSDAEIDSININSLNAGGSDQKSFSLTAPIASGTYYYGACIDEATAENDIRNNCSMGVAITVQNLAPVATDTPLPTPTLLANGLSVTIDMAPYFSDPNDDELSYQARTADPNRVKVHLFGGSESLLTIDPLGEAGIATVIVEAKDPDSRDWPARQDITVTVNAVSPITISVCDRTPQVRDALTRISSVVDCANITSVHLDALTTLVLAAEGITALQVDDFDGLGNLTVLNLSGNQLTELPAGIFVGLRNLTELDVRNNPSTPFILNPTPVRADTPNRAAVGPATIAVYVAQGAPFDMDVSLIAQGGTLSETTATIARGDTHSQAITVSQTGTGAVTVVPGGAGVPSTYYGIQVSPGNTLVLFDNGANQSPVAVGTIPAQTLTAGGTATTVNVSNYFSDPDGDTLTYTASSNNTTVATVSASGSTLTITPVAAGSATITITASDGTLTATQMFAATVNTANRTDVNGDGRVDVLDLVQVALFYGKRGENLPEDVNADGVINVADLVAVANGVDAADDLSLAAEQQLLLALAEAVEAEAVAEAPMGFGRHQHALSLSLTSDNVAAVLADVRHLASSDVRKLGKGVETVLEKLLQVLSKIGTIPQTTALLPNYPNPFNPETWIPYHLSKDTEVILTIYNVRGSVVRELRLGHQPAGIYQSKYRAAYWDGRNQLGEEVASGLYFYTLTADDFTTTRKLLIAK